jgi:hypothetical protein
MPIPSRCGVGPVRTAASARSARSDLGRWVPHQGGLVQTQNGEWWYMAFTMANGDRTGLAMLRDQSAWIGIRKDSATGATRLSMINGINMTTGSWATAATGTEAAGVDVSGGKIWLRVSANIQPGSGRTATFSYSTNGSTFTTLGPAFTLNNDWQFFMVYRFGIFNYATTALGGSVTVNKFTVAAPDPRHRPVPVQATTDVGPRPCVTTPKQEDLSMETVRMARPLRLTVPGRGRRRAREARRCCRGR